MSIPFNSPLGFIGLFLLAFGLFLVLAGFDIFTIQQVTVRKGPRTWGLGIAIVILGAFLVFPEVSGQLPIGSQNPSNNSNQNQAVDEDTPTPVATATEQEQAEDPTEEPTWRPLTFTIPNDGIWSQPSESSYFAGSGLTDSIAWSDEIIEGDFTLTLDVKSDFGNYGEGMVIVYGEGQSWCIGCLIFNITGYWQAVRIDTIYSDDAWLIYNENELPNDKYSMKIEIKGSIAKLFADNKLVASIRIPIDANRSGQIGLVKYWESASVTFSNIQILTP